MLSERSEVSRETQLKNAEAFRRLHTPGNPLVLYNVWDAGSAKVIANSGTKAIATSSWAVAKAHGFDDGEQIPIELVMENLRRIVGAVDLPVSVDLESGYGDELDNVARSIFLAIEAGAIGCNLEDRIASTGSVRDSIAQSKRIGSARQAAEAVRVPFFINARCDLFFQGDSVPHNLELVEKVVERAHLYKDAGADGLFVPGLTRFHSFPNWRRGPHFLSTSWLIPRLQSKCWPTTVSRESATAPPLMLKCSVGWSERGVRSRPICTHRRKCCVRGLSLNRHGPKV